MDNLNFLARRTLHHGHRARFELPAIFHCSYESAPGHHLSSDRHFQWLIHHRPLLRVRGRTLSIYRYADMPTMNIHISLKFHAVCAASKVLQNYNDLGLKEITINKINNMTQSIGLGLGQLGCHTKQASILRQGSYKSSIAGDTGNNFHSTLPFYSGIPQWKK